MSDIGICVTLAATAAAFAATAAGFAGHTWLRFKRLEDENHRLRFKARHEAAKRKADVHTLVTNGADR